MSRPRKQRPHRRKFPSASERKAVAIGVDELHGRLEWLLRDRPRALRGARERYRQFCADLYRQLKAVRHDR